MSVITGFTLVSTKSFEYIRVFWKVFSLTCIFSIYSTVKPVAIPNVTHMSFSFFFFFFDHVGTDFLRRLARLRQLIAFKIMSNCLCMFLLSLV